MKRFLIPFLLMLAATASTLGSDRIISYINENGVRVFTNAPSRSDEATESESLLSRARTETGSSSPATVRGGDLFRPLIEESANRHDVDPSLVEAIMAVESGFDPFAVSAKDCKGLMQLHPDTARRFGVEDVFDPAQNIEGGVKYLRYLLDFFEEDLEKVVAAYNAGENAVERHGGTPPYSETQNYLRKVSARYDLAGPSLEESIEARSLQVHRITLPDGRVLFTNTPTQPISY